MTDNPTDNPGPNPCGNPCPVPDSVAPGRADFYRVAAAVAADDRDGITQVLAELSLLHPAAWQSVIGAAAAEYVGLLVHLNGGDRDAVAAKLTAEAFTALDHANEVANRGGQH
ncbi:hypothetical protein EB75_02445 [Mycobacterium sp. ST-F2]|uniref:hypothetical protein n=1 Tax=Mycobacterium sp. ST-F2 TaxID=1490484 RepID=UPI00093BA344|nr:hypothetical protein [Mycobacterium sp. ST-F2]OKH76598.1 hypothetical protein EB75_02445 [Mycobacterium sp. ST-F2]